MNKPRSELFETFAIQGLGLRDYFAAKALTGLLTESSVDYQDEAIADLAYALADAMMKTRETK